MANVKSKTLKVEYGAPAPNRGSRHIRVFFEPGAWEPNSMKAMLVNSQLSAVMSVDPNSGDDADGQQTMACATAEVEPLEVIVDVKRVSLGDPRCAFSMTMPIETDAAHLDTFRFKNGKLKLTRIGNATSKADDEE